MLAGRLKLNLIFTIKSLSFRKSMLVCHCHALTDRDIRRAVRAGGACNVAEVGDHCGAATGCGGCHDLVAEIVQHEKRRLAMFPNEARQPSEPAAAVADLALTG